MTHESALSAALLMEAGLALLSSIYASEGGLHESMLAEMERALNGWFDGSSSTFSHSLGRLVGGLQPVKATSTNCVIHHGSGQ